VVVAPPQNSQLDHPISAANLTAHDSHFEPMFGILSGENQWLKFGTI
jgi:hypothetical protein